MTIKQLEVLARKPRNLRMICGTYRPVTIKVLTFLDTRIFSDISGLDTREFTHQCLWMNYGIFNHSTIFNHFLLPSDLVQEIFYDVGH